MNTTGFLRAYMAKGPDIDKFLRHVCDCISKEFEDEVKINNISEDEYEIIFKGYGVCLNKSQIEQLKKPGTPYALDSFLLNEFRKLGFEFDEYRSQYIMYCYYHFEGLKGVEVKDL